jgi:hypothetical protein
MNQPDGPAMNRAARRRAAREARVAGGPLPRPSAPLNANRAGRSAAKALGISANTVGTHIRSAYIKLGVQSRVQLTNALRDRNELD